MKRRVLKVGLFLLLGAIVNVAVAWGLVFMSSPMFPDGAVSPPADVRITTADDQKPGMYSIWLLSRCDRFGATRYMSFWAGPDAKWYWDGADGRQPERFLLRWAAQVAPWVTDRKEEESYRGADARGWPMLSMYSWWDGIVTQQGRRAMSISFSIADVHHGYQLSSQIPGRSSGMGIYETKILPTGMIPAGFAINTLFYAAIVWLLFAAPLALRRWQRRQRGLCPACAYPVGTSPVCTECGTPVTPRPRPRPRIVEPESP